MQAIWVSMRGNVKCVCKHSVEVLSPGNGLKGETKLSNETTSIGRRAEQKSRTMTRRRSSEHREASTHLIELRKGETSRNIVEMIYQSAERDSKKPMPVISKVLKVENSPKMHKRFEKHREMIKKMEFEKKGNQRQHPRVMADGNELIQFYTTFMSCNGKNGLLCNELSCGVCTTIQTGFENEKNGIVCSVGREAKGGMNVNVNGRRSVIVCRTIAGVMGYMNEKIEVCESIRSAIDSKLDYLIVRNPKAFLPCFVIVFED